MDKEAYNAYFRAYNKANRKKITEIQKKWRKTHSDEYASYRSKWSKQYYLNNAEMIKEKVKVYRERKYKNENK